MSIERNLRLALHQLVEAIEYTPMGVRGIKAMANARKALEEAKQPAMTEPVAWMHWLYGPVRLFLNKDEAMMELDRLNREYPLDADDRKMRPLVFGDAHPAPSVPADVVRDAERYRWLRKTRFIWSDFRYISGVHPTTVGLEFQWFPTQAQKPAREDLDVAIDEAMLAAKELK